tara:strand:+ start:426 stop:1049 length:624 start_codon:yes stop_codon:yes gene_type:complete
MKYLKRSKISKVVPVPRKGTKYVAGAKSHSNFGVPVVIAVRDMLGLARSSKEVKIMINDKLIKLNGKVVKDIREGVRLFNVLEAGKKFKLGILPTNRFTLEETKEDQRLCKVINKKVLGKKQVQLNLHDGTNIISKDEVNVGDSLYLDFESKIKKKVSMEKGSEVFVITGRSVGLKGKILEVENGNVKVDLNDKEVVLEKSHLIVQK